MYVLAVDDERYALDTLVWELGKVFSAGDIQEYTKASDAIEWAKQLADDGEKLDFAFLDIRMRGMDGLGVARQLKRYHPQVNVVFCTAFSDYAMDAFDLHAKGYLLKPITAADISKVLDDMVPDWRERVQTRRKQITVRTFGHFAVFVDGDPLRFERKKAEELFAYLVDRHGSPITTEQLSAVLWEGENYDRKLKNKTTSVISSLRCSLAEAGIEDILIKTWNHLALDVNRFGCDAYDFEEGEPAAVSAYRGEYMVNYSWAEYTNGHYYQLNELRKSNKI